MTEIGKPEKEYTAEPLEEPVPGRSRPAPTEDPVPGLPPVHTPAAPELVPV